MYKYVRTRTHLIEIGYFESPVMSFKEFDEKFGVHGIAITVVFKVENILNSFTYYKRTDGGDAVKMSVSEGNTLVETVIGIKSETIEPWSYAQMCEYRLNDV